MNGYSKFRENGGDHTEETSSQTLEECQEKDKKHSNHNNDIIPRKEPDMKAENFKFRRNLSTTSQRFAHTNSDLKNMMRRAFSTRKAYWRLEDDAGNGVVGNGDHFVQDHDLDKNYESTGNNVEVKKKKSKSFKRWKKIFHF